MARRKESKDYHKKLVAVHNLIATRQAEEAVEGAEAFMREYPDAPGGYFLLGLYAFSHRDFGDAIKLFNMAHERDPNCQEYADCLAILYTVTGKLADGLYFAKLATTMDSDPYIRPLIPMQLSNYFEALDHIQPSQHYVNALLLFNVGQFDEAARSCELELKENDRHEGCYTLLGNCHLRLGNYEKATSALHAALHLNPASDESVGLLGTALCHLGRFDEAFVCHRLALDRAPQSVDLATAALLDAEFLADSREPARAELRQELDRRFAALPASRRAIKRHPRGERRVRVAYISNKFHDSEQARFISALLKHHDRGIFEIIGYQQSFTDDSVTVDFKNSTDSWRKVADIQDPVMVRIINGDEVDVLVDLCGHTAANRAALIASHPAAVQMAWLEPPFGIQACGIDVVLTDPVTHETVRKAVGRDQDVVRLNSGIYALERSSFYPEVDDLPAASTGRLTFGGHCDLARLTPETAYHWSRALMASGRSKLLLGDVGEISGVVKNHVIDLFGHFGTADRVMFWDEPPDDHLKIAFFRQIDILLDTYPVSGRLEICKALSMGVPIITVKGPRRISQTGASILHSAGCAEWICDSVERMAELAASFAGDLDALAAVRRGLRDRVYASDLFSPTKLARTLESVYLTALKMKRRRRAKRLGKGTRQAPSRHKKASGKSGKTASKPKRRKNKRPAKKRNRRA